MTISSKKGDTVVEVDEAPRRDTSLEALAKLKPIFVKDGTHTAGNAPGVNDGAGAIVLRQRRVGQDERPQVARDDRRAGRGGRRLPLPRAHARERDRRSRSRRPA